jgi:hypothetical protein
MELSQIRQGIEPCMQEKMFRRGHSSEMAVRKYKQSISNTLNPLNMKNNRPMGQIAHLSNTGYFGNPFLRI